MNVSKELKTATVVAVGWCAVLIAANVWYLSQPITRFPDTSIFGLTTLVGPMTISPAMIVWLMFYGVQKRIPAWASATFSVSVFLVSAVCLLRTIHAHLTT